MLHQNMSHQNVYDPTGLHETPPLWLFTVSNTVSNTQFFATPASPSLTRSGSADSFASNHVCGRKLSKRFSGLNNRHYTRFPHCFPWAMWFWKSLRSWGYAILIGGTFMSMRRLIPMVIRGLGVCFGCRWMMSCFCRALVTSAPKRPDLIDRLFAGTVATKVGGSPHKQSSSAKLHPQAHVCQRSHGSCHHASPVLECMDAESIKFC